jgi:preprotein translocase subunit SecD
MKKLDFDLEVPLALIFLLFFSTAAAGELTSCGHNVTFRWNSGEAIVLNVSNPPAASLQNHPFLSNPEIVSVSSGRGVIGPIVTIRFGRAAAAVLAAQSSAHVHEQMLIMLDDTVVSAAIVMAPLSEVVVMQAPYEDERLTRLVDTLRNGGGCTGKI